ncbi:KpsF/GutQ family sugar-phosphate isomerase [Verrucomicrobia bacterium]|nr:KpsF/GutQ family sugar-phosphate isomerase [Verrucomicrobiota bacterium]MDG1891436.1 KpsF/GutQ family sugar-phosphate isomerase [Verrucomicrobiota bacterium]
MTDSPHIRGARKVFKTELMALEHVHDLLGDSFHLTVECLVKAMASKSKVVVVGVGKSGNIGRKIAATLTSTGTTSVFLDSVDALHGDVGVVTDGDVILMLSYSGETDELLNLLPVLKRFQVQLIGMTGVRTSALARSCNLILDVEVPREACPFNLAPTSSTTAMLVMGDALAMAVLQARGFRKADFAARHPSGAIGRALLLSIRDVMRKGERNPVATASTSVREALIIMGRTKSGCVSVVDEANRLVGIFTDGDLRRYLSHKAHPLEASVGGVMSPNPVTIQQDALAVEALNLFDKQNIDDLIVINAEGVPVGLIDTQDLPKMKLM